MTAPQVTARDISELLAWARRLSDAGPGNVTATEMAAYQTAKHDLIARITCQNQTTKETNR